MTRNERLARLLALLVPAALLAGAWGSQVFGHLYPCEMCHWQRWPHYAALPFALLAFVASRRSPGRQCGLRAFAIVAVIVPSSYTIGSATRHPAKRSR